jgi:protein gp37
MGANSAIEWTHHTFNPWRGCTKVSTGCAHCYAETQSKRNPKVLGIWGDEGTRPIGSESYWRQAIAWNNAAREAGERHRVFCASLGDVFEDRPELVAPRRRLLLLINETPHLDWLLLTKRPENIITHLAEALGGDVTRAAANFIARRRNIWFGFSGENQAEFNKRWDSMQAVKNLLRPAVIFLSAEPLLGPLTLPESFLLPDFSEDDPRYTARWVIAGGESGGEARPMDPAWARDLRDQCAEAHLAFHFKQWGEWLPGEADAQPPFWNFQNGQMVDGHSFPDITAEDVPGWDYDLDSGVVWRRVGKKAAGRLLDGREWSEFPKVEAAR